MTSNQITSLTPTHHDDSFHRIVAGLLEIWKEVLGVELIEGNENFFTLGGDSLDAARVASRIRDRLGRTVSLQTIFDNPALYDLAQRLEAHTCAFPVEQTYPNPGSNQRFPTTSSQRRLWFLDQSLGAQGVYNVYRLTRIQGNLWPTYLQEALEKISRRHAILRTTFVPKDGIPVPIVHSHLPISWTMQDRTDVVNLDSLHEARQQAKAIAAEGMDLTHGPLWKTCLWCLGPRDFLFLFVGHHMICDGWSIGRFFNELSQVYGAALKGHSATVPALPWQYSDYAVQQQQWQQTPAYREQLDYWKKILTPPLTTLDIPFSKSRPKQQTFHGSQHSFSFDSQLVAAIDQLAVETQTSRSMITLAAFQTVLHRYSGQEDLLIGTPVAQRDQLNTEALIGMFVNTLVLRTNLSGQPTFRELLQRVRHVTFGALANQNIPLEKLIEELRPPRDLSRQPFFQVLFAYQNIGSVRLHLEDCTLQAVPMHNDTAMFDLRLVIEESEENGLWAWIEFNTDLFDAYAIERMAGHFLTILQSATKNPDQTIHQLPLLTESEQQQILHQWNDTTGPVPPYSNLLDAFEEQVRRQPHGIAVVSTDKEYTFAEIDRRANQLAHYLHSKNVTPESFVGVCLKRSVDMIVSVLGVLKAGCAYVPLDPSYPKDRLGYMLQDSQASVILTQKALLDRLPESKKPWICLDRITSELATQNSQTPKRTTTQNSIAYVVYTSGSTGKPKGVVLRHAPVINVLDWVNQTFGVTATDRILFVTSLSFDLSVYDIFGVLGAGASIRIAGEEELRDPSRLLQILRREPITMWDSAPAALQQLMPFFDQHHTGDKSDFLRLVMLSGDWIPVPLPDQVRRNFPNAEVISLGGATEAAIWSNWYRIGTVDPAWPSIPYGKPIRNARYHILDSHLQPVPVGVPGELHIGGPVLADGYLNRPELTAERFITHTFPTGTVDRLYKTGDLARYMPDGNIEFLGRMDSQVKIRGFRVETGEIEVDLTQHPSVREAVVKAHRDSSGQMYLTAYLVLHKQAKLTEEDVDRFLKQKLPEYMIPASVVFLEQMPITANGKVDRSALLPPDRTQSHMPRLYVAPMNDAERALQGVWEEVLNIKPIGMLDNFYDLGGHSLMAAVLMARIETKLGHKVPLETLFNAGTIREMAALITHKLELSKGIVVPFQTEGSKPPLILIAGAGGHVFAFHKFARTLGLDYPVYGLKAVGVDGSEPPLDCIKQIASRYMEAILKERPKGPFVLGGYSVGGLIAFELALQMQKAGLDVARVLVFDMLAPGYPKKLPLPYRAWLHFVNFCKLNRKKKWAYVQERLENIRRRFLRWFDMHDKFAPVIPGMDVIPQYVLKRVWGALNKAKDSYWPDDRFDGTITLVSSDQPIRWAATRFPDPLKGWSQWSTQPVELYKISVGHLEIFHDQNLDLLSQYVQAVLDGVVDEQNLTQPRWEQNRIEWNNPESRITDEVSRTR